MVGISDVAVQAKASKLSLSGFINFVIRERPLIANNSVKIAEAVADEFGIQCEESDVLEYQDLHIEIEDYELEDRKHLHGVIY